MHRLLLFLLASACFAQTLTISGAVPTPVTLSMADLAAMPRISATYVDNAVSTVYEGVPVAEVLKKAGIQLGLPHGGKILGLAVIATGQDGYRVVFAMAEFDPGFKANPPVITDNLNGKPLAEKMGPLRLVIPLEKKGARSVRMLEKLDVVDLSTK